MSIISKLGVYHGSILPLLLFLTRGNKSSESEMTTEDIKALQKEFSERHQLSKSDDVTEKDLIYFLYLNPTGYIDESEDSRRIMQSAIAEQYFKIGIITKGVGDGMRFQYRLTTFGRSQIKNAAELERLK